jgi:hypothetical protein
MINTSNQSFESLGLQPIVKECRLSLPRQSSVISRPLIDCPSTFTQPNGNLKRYWYFCLVLE